jgi:hypothetical protein
VEWQPVPYHEQHEPIAKTVEVSGARVHLTSKEYQMLELLSLRKGISMVAWTSRN